MANYTPRVALSRGPSCLRAVAIVSWFGAMALTGAAVAQQPEPSKKAAPVPPPTQKRTFAAPLGPQRAWVKVCEKATAVSKGKDGKEEKRDFNICLTSHELLDGRTGMVAVSAAVRQVEGQDRQDFIVTVPLGMLIDAGLHIAIYPKDLWERAQKQEKIDETKLKGIKLDFLLCHPSGCTAEAETTPELINDLKSSGGLVVFAVNAGRAPVAFPVLLDGFEQAYAGIPMDKEAYSESRKALMQKLEQVQQDKDKKQQAEGQKSAPAQTPPAQKK